VEDQVARVVRMPKGSIALAAAADAFTSQPDLAPTTVRSYRQTLDLIVAGVGAAARLDELRVVQLEVELTRRWGGSAPATWNRHVGTVRSFVEFCRRRGWPVQGEAGLDRRREHEDRTRSIPAVELEGLWRRDDIALRDKTLWRLLYESAARATEILGLDIEDLDVENKRARVRSKGGATEFIHFQTGTARLLPRLLAGRASGPVFLADRRPAPARVPAARDVDPTTGRARLSYRRAEEIFHNATGWTLHQLRHSAITHLAEENVALPLLMAKSRHASLRSLQRYARPGVEAVAALTAAHDPARRRR
jgi:integrase/recombinase XerC/integrase/recombinase XerD